MNATLPAPVCAIQYRIAEQNLPTIERRLRDELRAIRFVPSGARLNWRGIYVLFTEDDGVLHAEVDGVLDFVAEWGMPATHSRALQIARDELSTCSGSVLYAMADAWDRYQLECREEARDR